MPPSVPSLLSQVLRRLRADGLLLFTDPQLPSVVSTVTKGPVRGSWWGHPAGKMIYRVGEALEEHPDVMELPLIRRKQTLVHRRLWPEILAVGHSREAWQLAGLSPAGQSLLRAVDAAGQLRIDAVPSFPARRNQKIGEIARDLQYRLLVQGGSFHTETGQHGKWLATWAWWGEKHGTPRLLPTPAEARSRLEMRVRAVYPEVISGRSLPWIK